MAEALQPYIIGNGPDYVSIVATDQRRNQWRQYKQVTATPFMDEPKPPAIALALVPIRLRILRPMVLRDRRWPLELLISRRRKRHLLPFNDNGCIYDRKKMRPDPRASVAWVEARTREELLSELSRRMEVLTRREA